MVKNQVQRDHKVVEAEEDLLIDFQFLVQDLISSRRMSRTELAQKTGLSKARLSQILSAEANPTVRTFARLFHALDAKVVPKCLAERQAVGPAEKPHSVWEMVRNIESRAVAPRLKKRNAETVSDWRGASNDNYIAVTGDTKSLVA